VCQRRRGAARGCCCCVEASRMLCAALARELMPSCISRLTGGCVCGVPTTPQPGSCARAQPSVCVLAVPGGRRDFHKQCVVVVERRLK
jgi:hypothetical protein